MIWAAPTGIPTLTDETEGTAVSTSWTPDEIEQHQRADGTVEPDVAPPPTEDSPRDPDELEQQRSTTDDDVDAYEGLEGRPLSADEIEQRQPVGGDEDEGPDRKGQAPHYPAGADEE